MSDQRHQRLRERFDKAETTKRKARGRPPSDKDRVNITFRLDRQLIADIDTLYHELNSDLLKTAGVSISKVTFREWILRKGLTMLPEIREELRRRRKEE